MYQHTCILLATLNKWQNKIKYCMSHTLVTYKYAPPPSPGEPGAK